jgi:hypothetical protein
MPLIALLKPSPRWPTGQDFDGLDGYPDRRDDGKEEEQDE